MSRSEYGHDGRPYGLHRNRFGEVLGVNTFKVQGENLNFVVRIQILCEECIGC
jgi:hypothetical protein